MSKAPTPKSTAVVPVPAWRRGISAAALMHAAFPPIRYIVPDYIVEGLTILAGAPKARKSWMVLDVALSVAAGGEVFGTVPCQQGDVLYLALEDNQRRLQDRMRKMGITDAPERLTLCTEWPVGSEALAEIEAWAGSVERPTLVAVDVLARVREPTNGEANYESDYRSLVALHDLALRLGIAIVAVHHNRKSEADDPFDLVSGTRGITGAADTVLVIRREHNGASSKRATLYGRGRDIPEIERALEFSDRDFRWNVLGDFRAVASTVEQQNVLDLLIRAKRPMKLCAIAGAVGKQPATVRNSLVKMIRTGRVTQPRSGWYEAA